MSIEFSSFYKRLGEEVGSTSDFVSSLHAIMDWCNNSLPHPLWEQVLAFDAAAELQAARNWLPPVLSQEPLPFPVRGLWFGLGEFADKRDSLFADCSIELFGNYNSADPKCGRLDTKNRYAPAHAYLNSRGLKNGGLLANASSGDGKGNTVYICFSLSFITLLLCRCLSPLTFNLLRGRSGVRRIGVATGFNCGDVLFLGELTQQGLRPDFRVV